MAVKSFLIIGMGSFGTHLCKALAKRKCDIMIADSDEDCVEKMLPYVTSAKIGNCCDEQVLRSFDIPSFDACFVCMGNNFQNSLQITNLLKELGAKKVYSKAEEDIQAKFLLNNGADKIIYSEKEIAEKIALVESSSNVFDRIELSSGYDLIEMRCPAKWVGKSIMQLNIRFNYQLNVIALRTEEKFVPLISPDYVFAKDDHIIVLGSSENVEKLG